MVTVVYGFFFLFSFLVTAAADDHEYRHPSVRSTVTTDGRGHVKKSTEMEIRTMPAETVV